MKSFKFFWATHKWTGIILAILFTVVSVTGFMLLLKKRIAWIQPPTQNRGEADVDRFITMPELFGAVVAHGHADFQSIDDVDRVDFRPGKAVFKVRSNHNHSELQIDAFTGEIVSDSWRPSDLIEQIHDGSFFADWVHDWVMPVVAISMLFLVFSGLWLWIEPLVRRRRRRKARRAA